MKNHFFSINVWRSTGTSIATRKNVQTEKGAACIEYCALIGCSLCLMVGIASTARNVGHTLDRLSQFLGGGSISSDADGLVGCEGNRWLNGACASDDNTDDSDEIDNAGQP